MHSLQQAPKYQEKIKRATKRKYLGLSSTLAATLRRHVAALLRRQTYALTNAATAIPAQQCP
jgi:hypothetical protein